MRFAFAFLLGLAACGGSSSSSDAGADLSVFIDASAGEGCFSIAECAFECATTDSSCVSACIAQGTTDAQSAYQALLMCGYDECTGDGTDGGGPLDPDAGTQTCMDSTDTSAACEQCAQNKIQSIACSSLFSACSGS